MTIKINNIFKSKTEEEKKENVNKAMIQIINTKLKCQ